MAESEDQQAQSRVNWIPVPDPTERTKADLKSEIAALKEILLRELGHVRELAGEQFRGVDAQFDAIDDRFQDVARRTAEQKTDTKDALDAALQAAKDAVSLQTEASDKAIAKSETATTKQIDALAVLVDKSDERRGEEINDLKNRIVRLETSGQNQGEAKTDTRGSMMLAAMVGSGVIGALGFIAAVTAIVVNIVQ